MRYVALPETWFKAGTECQLIADFRPSMSAGLFRGIRVCENPEAEAKPIGLEYEDEEICPFSEFETIEA